MPALPNPRHEAFAQALAAGKSQEQAYALAGFKANRGNASTLVRKQQSILKRVEEIQGRKVEAEVRAVEKLAEKIAVSKEYVISRLRENVDRAMQHRPVLDAEGNPTGEYRYDGMVANKALELLGKTLGLYIERKEIGDPGEFERMSDAELDQALREEVVRLGIGAPGNETAH